MKIGIRPKGEKVSYSWKFCDDNDMVFWTDGSSGRYFGRPTDFVPANAEQRAAAAIKIPAAPARDALSARGIIAGGFAEKSRGYFHTIGRHGYANFVAVISGSLRVRGADTTAVVGRGEFFLVPTDSGCTVSAVRAPAKILWFHLGRGWGGLSRGRRDTLFGKCGNLPLLLSLSRAYESEIFSQADSSVLENCADAIAYALRREFSPQGRQPEVAKKSVAEYVAKLGRSAKIVPLAHAAAQLGVSGREIDGFCLQTRGANFSKHVHSLAMRRASRLLAAGKSCAYAAEKIGYANQFSFSRAFAAFFGRRPSEYRG